MATATHSTVLSASTLTGDSVRNSKNEELGTIKDIMIDVNSGKIAYAVLSFGGFLGMGDKLFAVPFKAFRVDTANECMVLDVDQEQLENARGFDQNDWPDMADQRWQADVHKTYGVDPYWK